VARSSAFQDLLALSYQEPDDGIVVRGEDFLQTVGKCLELCNRINVVVIHHKVVIKVEYLKKSCHGPHGHSVLRNLPKQQHYIVHASFAARHPRSSYRYFSISAILAVNCLSIWRKIVRVYNFHGPSFVLANWNFPDGLFKN